MPARNKKVQPTIRRAKKRSTRTHSTPKYTFSLKKLLVYGVVFVFIALIITLIRTPSQFWNSSKKLSVVYPVASGDVEVAVFDPRLNEITRVVVPSTTEVTTARQLGTWKVKSLWQLGENENLEGALLAETLTNHLQMPTVAWADNRFEGFVNGSTKDAIKSFATLSHTNLSFKDKLFLLFFTTKINNTGYNIIHLSDTSYLRETELEDGTAGYTTFATLPQEIAAVFTANSFSGREVTVALYDQSNSSRVAVEIGKVVEVLGAKVALVSNYGGESDVECTVRGRDSATALVLADVFRCKAEITETKTSFDIEMTIGNEFVRRF